MSDEGRDAGEVLGKHLDAAEIENVTRKGTIKAKGTDKVVRTETTEASEAPVGGEARPRPARARAGAADAEPTLETAAAPTRPGTAEDGEPPARAARATIPAPVAVEAVPVPAPTVETAPAPSKPQPRASRAARPGTPRAPGTKRTEARSRAR